MRLRGVCVNDFSDFMRIVAAGEYILVAVGPTAANLGTEADMTILKKLFLLIAVGLAPIVLAGCYGAPMPDRSFMPDDAGNLPTLDAAPVAGLQTIAHEKQ